MTENKYKSYRFIAVYIQQYRKLNIFRVEMNMHNNDDMIIKESIEKYKTDESRM